MENKLVLVVGATGAVGLKVVTELIAKGAAVRAMVRATSNRARIVSNFGSIFACIM